MFSIFDNKNVLVWRGKTTYEYLKQAENKSKNAAKQSNYFQKTSNKTYNKTRTKPNQEAGKPEVSKSSDTSQITASNAEKTQNSLSASVEASSIRNSDITNDQHINLGLSSASKANSDVFTASTLPHSIPDQPAKRRLEVRTSLYLF